MTSHFSRRASIALFTALLIALAHGGASAQPALTTVLETKMQLASGAELVGHALAFEPGRRVVLRLEDGGVQIVQWQEIAHIDGPNVSRLPTVPE